MKKKYNTKTIKYINKSEKIKKSNFSEVIFLDIKRSKITENTIAELKVKRSNPLKYLLNNHLFFKY